MAVTRKISFLLAVVAALAFGPAFAADLGTATTENMEKMGNGSQSRGVAKKAKKAPRKK